jgi:hypothetical protein
MHQHLREFAAKVHGLVSRAQRSTISASSAAVRASQQFAPLFDHVIGACQQRVGYCETDRLGGLKIDYQLIST